MAPIKNIIIVGAGPAGLLLALLLSNAGINVKVLEKEDRPTDQTRAVFYQPISMFEFRRAGIFDDVQEAGFQPRSAAAWDLNGKKLFGLPGQGQVALKVNKLAEIAKKRLDKNENAEVKYGQCVVDVGQDDPRAWVKVETHGGSEVLHADFVVGCDGGQSTVRKIVSGEKVMPGFTWDKELIAADVGFTFDWNCRRQN